MQHIWKDDWLAFFTSILFIVNVCKSQRITTCANNVLIHVEANETRNFIYSYDYPNNYAYTATGDCRIVITTTKSKIHVTIDEYNKRTNENTLNIFDGPDSHSSLLAGTNSIDKGKTLTSKVNKLYITHWSYGNENNAFIISYFASTSDKEDDEKDESNKNNNEEEDDKAWIAAPIVGSLVGMYCFCIIFNKKKQQQQQQRPNNNQVNTGTTQQQANNQQNTNSNPKQVISRATSIISIRSTTLNQTDETSPPQNNNNSNQPERSALSILQPPPPFQFNSPPPAYSELEHYPTK